MCRLRKIKHAIKANSDSPILSPPIKPVEIVSLLSKRKKNELEFERLQKRLTKQIAAINEKREKPLTIDYIYEYVLSPKSKRGIMDNIGKIFESTYALPGRPIRNFNAE